MAEDVNSFGQGLGQLAQFVRELSIRQKVLIVAATVLVGATLFVFVRMMAKPDMKPLMAQMDPQDAQALAAQLASRNIRYEISQDGSSVLVPAEQLDQARLETASQGVPRSGRMGFELFDKPNWAGSDFSEKVNYQRALQGELERTIQSLRGVQAARVHLVLPEDSVFVDREQSAKASVVLRLRGGLDAQAQLAIANLVAGAVEKLRPENVSVIDADTNRPLGDSGERDLAAQGGKYEDQMAARLVQTLEPVVGHGRVRASVHLERDITSGEETQETYDPSATVALTMQRSEERIGSSAPSGVPGTASNVPGASGTASVKTSTTDDSSQNSKSESGTYAVNKLVRHTLVPAGRVKRITAAVLVDDASESRIENGSKTESRRKRTPEELKQIEDLARASLGLDPSRGDSLSVQSLSFQPEPAPAPVPPAMPERVRVVVQQWSSLLRLAAVGLLFFAVYLMLLRPVKNQLLLSFREMSQRLRAKPGKATTIEGAVQGAQESLEGEAESPVSARFKKQVLGKAKSDPLATSRLLQSWMREEGAK